MQMPCLHEHLQTFGERPHYIAGKHIQVFPAVFLRNTDTAQEWAVTACPSDPMVETFAKNLKKH